MRNFKSQRGAITILVLVSMIFMVSFLITAQVIAANKVKNQKAMLQRTRDIYESDKSMEEMYNMHIGDDIIPIYTADELLLVGSGEELLIKGKIYTLSDDKIYMLRNDINIEEDIDDEHFEPNSEIQFEGSNIISVTDSNGITRNYKAQNGSMRIFVNGYTSLDYIQADGTQYINTGYIPNQDIEIELKYDLDSNLNSGSYIGLYGNPNLYGAFRPEYKLFYAGYGSSSNNFSNALFSAATLRQERNRFSFIENNRTVQLNANDFTGTTPIYIFNKSKEDGSLFYTYSTNYFKLYYFKIWSGNELVQELIPFTRNDDNVIGLYDIINNEFYSSETAYGFTGE